MAILYSQTTQNTSLAQNQRQIRAWPIVATGSGVVNTAKVWSNSTAKTFRIELWSDNGGNASTMRPVNLLASQQYTASTTGEHTVTFSSPATLVSGTRYWVSFVTQETGNWAGANSAVSPLRVTGNTFTNFSDASPNPWVTTAAGTSAGDPYLILESNQTSILSIDPLVSGEIANVTLTDGSLVPNQVNITSGGVTKTAALSPTAAPFQYSFTCPSPIDGQTMLLIGNNSVTVTDGVTTTPSTNTTYSIRSAQPDNASTRNFSSVTFVTIDGVNNIGTLLGWTPALKTNGQAAFDSTRAIIYNDGTVDFQDYTGTSIFYFRDPDDFICRTWTVETVEGSVTITRTVYKCKDNQSPNYHSKYIDGNRPSVSSVTGSITNGSTIILNGFFSNKRNGQLFTRIATPAQAGQELVPSYIASTSDSWLGSGASIVAQTTAGSDWKLGGGSPIISHEPLTECHYSMLFKAQMINYGVGAESPQIKFERPLVYTGHAGMLDQILFYSETGSGSSYGGTGQLQANWVGNTKSSYCSVNNAGLSIMFDRWCRKIGYYKPNSAGRKDGSVYQYLRDESTKTVLFNYLDAGVANCNDQRYTTDIPVFAEPVYYFDDNNESQIGSQFWLPFFKRPSTVLNMWVDALIANDSPESVWLINGSNIDTAFNTGKAVHIPQLTRTATQITATVYLGDLLTSDNIYVVVQNSNGRFSTPVLVRAAT